MERSVTEIVVVVLQGVETLQDDVLETVQLANSGYLVTKRVTKVVKMGVCETVVFAIAVWMERTETYVIRAVVLALQDVTESLDDVVEIVQLACSGSFVTKHAANTVEMDVSGLRAAVMMVAL